MRVLTAIQHAIDDRFLSGFHPVINRVWKPFGQQPVKTKNLPVNPSIQHQ